MVLCYLSRPCEVLVTGVVLQEDFVSLDEKRAYLTDRHDQDPGLDC